MLQNIHVIMIWPKNFPWVEKRTGLFCKLYKKTEKTKNTPGLGVQSGLTFVLDINWTASTVFHKVAVVLELQYLLSTTIGEWHLVWVKVQKRKL